jgi:hypothetical protein
LKRTDSDHKKFRQPISDKAQFFDSVEPSNESTSIPKKAMRMTA